jgi:hypothetical protein
MLCPHTRCVVAARVAAIDPSALLPRAVTLVHFNHYTLQPLYFAPLRLLYSRGSCSLDHSIDSATS